VSDRANVEQDSQLSPSHIGSTGGRDGSASRPSHPTHVETNLNYIT